MNSYRSALLLATLLLIPISSVVAQEVSEEEIGAEWNNSTSVEFPATSTDEEGNVIYNYYGDDSQYFLGPSNPEGNGEEEGSENDGEIEIPLNDPDLYGAAEGLIQDLINSIANNGLTGTDGTLTQDDYDFFFGSSGSSDFRLIFGGSIIRDELKKKGIEKITLLGWDPNNDELNIINWLPLSKGDLSLVAAAAIVRDAHIEQVELTLKQFSVAYSFRGYLFYFIPFNFTALISVNAQLEDGSRVSVLYPWYQWFLWKPIANADLDTRLESVVHQSLSIESTTDFERQARIFGLVAESLRSIQQ